jgi:hypothetical protein
MADDTTVGSTNGGIALRPYKRPMRSFFDFFGVRALRLNNDPGAMVIFFSGRFS